MQRGVIPVILLMALSTASCDVSRNAYQVYDHVAVPVGSQLHVNNGLACTAERLRDLRWDGGRLLYICREGEWQPIEVLPESRGQL